MISFAIASTWDGASIPPAAHAYVQVARIAGELVIEVDAPFHGDPPPPHPPGNTPRLWEHEVVELFLVGEGDRYLEVELGPHGHFLALALHGVRSVVREGIPVAFRAEIVSTAHDHGATRRFRGRATLDAAWIPAGELRGNAYAIAGTGAERTYFAAHPVPGPGPDFHRIAMFPRVGPLGEA